MQIDFHFYTIYALARAAGFIPDNAFTIAYSSQHTDDAKYEHALEFQNGGRFQQVLTAHKFLDLGALDKKVCYRIWVPFHFLPGNLGVEFYERMVTRPGSIVAQSLFDELLSSNPRPYLLHRLGIFLHCFADTWSHQNFLGLERADLNDVKRLSVKNLEKASFKSFLRKLKGDILEYAAPKLGHAQAGTIPDEPYREWKYENYLGKKFDISNVERSLDAAQNCYQAMLKFLGQFPGFSQNKPMPWHEITGKIRTLFETDTELEGRIKAWKDAISAGEFGPKPEGKDTTLDYDDREWFREAVKVEKPSEGDDLYERNPGFENSHWKYFHDAGALHRFCVLHEVLPEHGMICG
ncbi:MAG: hypothetical protein JRJ66_02905 [Deltaproteobacteria bacterium]|nr:hypothetical protein [Deltaproteobacteria bacterium]